MKTPHGSRIFPGCEEGKNMTRLEYFILMFPPNQLTEMVRLTNRELKEKEEKSMTIGEMVEFMGICIIITRFQFLSRQYLWSQTAPSKYVPAFKLGQLTVMARNKFDMIWSYLIWSHQPKQREEVMTHEKYRWLLVNNCIDCFSTH